MYFEAPKSTVYENLLVTRRQTYLSVLILLRRLCGVALSIITLLTEFKQDSDLLKPNLLIARLTRPEALCEPLVKTKYMER